MTDKKPSELWPEEFYDVDLVLKMGAEKYGPNDWLEESHAINHKSNHDSMFHHLAESFTNKGRDFESGLHPLLHLACRALMGHVRFKRGLDYFSVPGMEEISVNSKGKAKKQGKDLTVSDSGHGYKTIHFKGKNFYVHRLMVQTFLGPIPEGFCVNHIDGVKDNNDLNNLECITLGDNVRHAFKNNLMKPLLPKKGEDNPAAKLTSVDVNEIRELLLTSLTQTEIAKIYNVTQSTISGIGLGKTWTNTQRGLDNE